MVKCGTCGAISVSGSENKVASELVIRLEDSRLEHIKKMPDGTDFVIPFFCEECGAIKTKVRPIWDRVFVYWYIRETTDSGLIIIPQSARKIGRYNSNEISLPIGVIIAKGDGYTRDDGSRVDLQEVGIGDWIVGDMRIPHQQELIGNDGKGYMVSTMGFLDIKAKVDLFGKQ